MPTGIVLDVWNDGLSEMRRSVDLDLRADLQFPLTYQIADIREPQNRKSDSSKTVKVPGSRGNDRLFAQLFEIGADSTFNVNLKRDCWVLQDGLQIFEGSIRMRKITRNDWNEVAYDTLLQGRLADIFSSLKDDEGLELKLTDLDMSEWSHLRTRDAILGSWVGNITRDGSPFQSFTVGPTYSVVDTLFSAGGRTTFSFGGATHSLQVSDVVRFEMDNPGSTTVAFDRSQGHHTVTEVGPTSVTVNLSFSSGNTNTGTLSRYVASGLGYVYPTVNLGKNSLTDTRWHETDYVPAFYARTLVDAIFKRIGYTYESTFFESDYFRRLVVYGGTSLTNPGIIATQQNPEQAIDSFGRFRSVMDSSPSIQWSIDPTLIDGEYTYQNATGATLSVPIDFSVRISEAYPGALSQVFLSMRVYRNFNAGGATDTGWSTGFGNVLAGNGVTGPNTIFTVINTGVTGPFSTYVAPGVIEVNRTLSYDLRPYERLRVVWLLSPGSLSTAPYTTYLNYAADTEDLVVPPDVSAKDFLVMLINAFNLYVDPDRTNDRNVIIEPFDYYYNSQAPLDWTSKLDISQEVEIEPVSPGMARSFLFSYQDDSDFHNKGYLDAFSETYGQMLVGRDNDFNTSKREIRLPAFAATPLVDTLGSSDLVLPTIVKDASWSKLDKFKPRLLYFTGIRYSPKGFAVGVTGATGATFQPTRDEFGVDCYGYAGHLDNPIDATLDVDFGVLRLYYYGSDGAFRVTEDGLYNRFYRRWLDELTDPETRMVTGSFKLTPHDLSNISFRRLIQVQGTNYRLQKIEDYDPLTGAPCRVELLKVKQAAAYGAGSTSLGIGVNPTQGTGTVPPLPGSLGVGDNVTPIGTSIGVVGVLGTDNTVLASDVVQVVGVSNTVDDSTRVFVLGNQNRVR